MQWLLTAVLRFSAVLSGRPGYFDSLKIVCKVHFSATQASPDMLRVYSQMFKDGQMDSESFIELAGLSSDVDAMLARMNAERTLKEGTAEKLGLLFELLEKGIITTQDVKAEAERLGVLSQSKNNASAS